MDDKAVFILNEIIQRFNGLNPTCDYTYCGNMMIAGSDYYRADDVNGILDFVKECSEYLQNPEEFISKAKEEMEMAQRTKERLENSSRKKIFKSSAQRQNERIVNNFENSEKQKVLGFVKNAETNDKTVSILNEIAKIFDDFRLAHDSYDVVRVKEKVAFIKECRNYLQNPEEFISAAKEEMEMAQRTKERLQNSSRKKIFKSSAQRQNERIVDNFENSAKQNVLKFINKLR
ncbi:MAG: hypothetical protein LBM38_01010 [Clostridiales bacterium]|jgi:fructose-specific component phosphotransferase system IIB-like protein|nr:hypothetical protein [Clostridiales bacterium]